MIKFAPILIALLYGFAMYYFSATRLRRDLNERSSELRDAGLQAELDRLGDALDLPRIRLNILEMDPINGLAASDGRIFITRGFYRKYQEGAVTGPEMASVVAHELGHVALDHTRRRMIDFAGQNALRTAVAMIISRFVPGVGPVIAGALMSLIMARLSRKDEYEADSYATALMIKAGFGAEPQKTLFAKLNQLSGSLGGAPAWLLSHPKAEDRIRAIEANEARWL